MSRTHHARPRNKRSDPTIAAKKPDESRRWHRRFLKSHDIAPARDERRLHSNEEDDMTPLNIVCTIKNPKPTTHALRSPLSGVADFEVSITSGGKSFVGWLTLAPYEGGWLPAPVANDGDDDPISWIHGNGLRHWISTLSISARDYLIAQLAKGPA